MSGGITQIKHRGQHPYRHSSSEIKHSGYASLKDAVNAALQGGNNDDHVIAEGKSVIFGTGGTPDAIITYNPNSDFGGANGQLEIKPEGDLKFQVNGSLAGTAVVFYRAKQGSNKHLRFTARADRAGGQCGIEVGELNLSTGYFRYDGTFDQLALFLTPSAGNHLVLASANQRSNDQDIVPQTDPALAVKSNLNPNTDGGETILLNYKGLFSGVIDNADPLLSSREMESDRAAFPSYHSAVHAKQQVAALTNPDGGDRIDEAGDANLLDTTAGNGGDLIQRAGEGNENGRHGRHIVKRRGIENFSGELTYQNRLDTDDAVKTPIEVISTEDDTVIHVTTTVSAIKDDSTSGASYVIMAAFRNDSGVLNQIGLSTNVHVAEDVAGLSAVIEANGTDIEVGVTGIAANDYKWSSNTKVYITNN